MKKLLLTVTGLVLLGAIASPVEAKGKPPKKPKVFVNPGYVHKSVGLQPGHKYRIQVTSPTHVSFTATGFQDLSWLNKGKVGSMTKPIQFKGTTPKSVDITTPVSGTVLSWIVGITVQDNSYKPIKIQFIDLSKHK